MSEDDIVSFDSKKDFVDPPTESESEYTVTETELDTDNESCGDAISNVNRRSKKGKSSKKKVSDMTPEQKSKHEERRKLKHHQYKEKMRAKRSQSKSEKSDLSGTERKLQVENNINDLIEIANGMYRQLKEIVKESGEKFTNLADKKKLQFFREELKYDEFMKEFPVTTRYLICMGQYSAKAFRRFLDKVRLAEHPPPTQRPKGYMEDQWVRRQADYVRFLWEAYQKRHWNNAEAKLIWDEAYKRLKGEFDDFRDKYKDVEENIKEEKKKHNAEVAKELLERYASGTQAPQTEEEKQNLLHMLQNQLYRHRYNKMLSELTDTRTKIAPVAQGRGTNDGPEDKPTIRMIEHIDPKRMHEVPEHMKLTKEEEAKLPTKMV